MSVENEKGSLPTDHPGSDKPETTLVEDVEAAGHGEVYKRHGRVDLSPMPSDSPADPLNWPSYAHRN
ncbi:hypothetical protein FB451DRAFT_1298974 [Mycena latifolia]|nr:hypothetical protein FB451DRAFT_1298974 [Mycena latifolia]